MFAQAVVDALAVLVFERLKAVVGGNDGYQALVVAGVEYVDDGREFRAVALDRDRLGAEVVDAEIPEGFQPPERYCVVVIAGAREFTDVRSAEDFYSLSSNCIVGDDRAYGQ